MSAKGLTSGVVRALVWGLIAAYVLHGLVRFLGFRLHAGGLVGLCLLAAAMFRLVRATREPPPALRLPPSRPGGPPPDRPFERVERIEDRLYWGGRTPHHFDAGVVPVLRRIAEDRLHRKHGIDLGRQPDAARLLLGEELWRLLAAQAAVGPAKAPTVTRPPTPAEMETLVRRLEAI